MRGRGHPYGWPRRLVPGQALPLEVDHVLQDLVRRRDDAGVRLETALGDDQVRELLGQVDVAHLERSRGQLAAAVGARLTDVRDAGVDGVAVERAADLLEAGRVVEVGQRHLAERVLEAVAEDTHERAVTAERERLEGAHGGTVLAERADAV